MAKESVMNMPKGWSYSDFTEYILTCAIRDRQQYLDSLNPDFDHTNEYTINEIEKTRAEIVAMHNRKKKSDE